MSIFAAAAFTAAAIVPTAGAQEARLPPVEERSLAPDPLKAQLDRIERYLNSIDTLEARFTQESPDGGVSRGVLSLDRPGKLRFEYTDATPLLLVSDGDLLTFVDYEVGQVSRWPVEETLLGLLVAREVDLSEAGAVVALTGESETGRIAVSARDPARPEDGLLTLYLEETGSGLRLEGWQVTDARGAVTRIWLETLRTDIALADELWTFDDPRALPSQRRRRGR